MITVLSSSKINAKGFNATSTTLKMSSVFQMHLMLIGKDHNMCNWFILYVQEMLN